MKKCTFNVLKKSAQDNSQYSERIINALVNQGYVHTEDHPEITIVLGGDGGLLRKVHDHSDQTSYVLINFGHLGFFADYDVSEIDSFIVDFLKEEPEVEKIPIFEMINGKNKAEFINDVVLQTMGTCFLDIRLDEKKLTYVRCSGIVVSSAGGSTGYLTSLASPLVIGAPDVYQYSTIAPCYNRLSINPINKAVIDANKEMTIINEGDISISVDGIPYEKDGDTFTIRRLENRYIQLLHFRHIEEESRIRKNISGLED